MKKYWSYYFSKLVWSPGIDKLMNTIKPIITLEQSDNFYYIKPYETRRSSSKESAKS